MRRTLLEHGDKITALETEMRAGFATMGTGTAQITVLLKGIADSEQD